MRVGPHHQQITGKFIGSCSESRAYHIVYRLERRSVGCDVVRGEVLLQIRRKWSAPLLIF
jgi:hypothetical protein